MNNEISKFSFEEAIAYTENLFSNTLPADLEAVIAQLIATDNGARGFYVYYLTNSVADQPNEAILQAIRQVPEPSAELLVKNLAMSTAMAIAHRRNHNEAQAQGSDQVKMRTANLIQKLNLAKVTEIGQLMQESARSGTGVYVNFFTKWGYDAEQKQAIAAAF